MIQLINEYCSYIQNDGKQITFLKMFCIPRLKYHQVYNKCIELNCNNINKFIQEINLSRSQETKHGIHPLAIMKQYNLDDLNLNLLSSNTQHVAMSILSFMKINFDDFIYQQHTTKRTITLSQNYQSKLKCTWPNFQMSINTYPKYLVQYEENFSGDDGESGIEKMFQHSNTSTLQKTLHQLNSINVFFQTLHNKIANTEELIENIQIIVNLNEYNEKAQIINDIHKARTQIQCIEQWMENTNNYYIILNEYRTKYELINREYNKCNALLMHLENKKIDLFKVQC